MTITTDPMELILDSLEGVKSEPNGQHSARCPAHKDRVSSLSIAVGDDGRVLLHCHAGCSLDDVLGAMNPTITKRELFSTSNGSVTQRNGKKKIVATYNYTNENGDPLYEVVRYNPKDFRQRRPNGKGGWIWNLKGVDRVLYRLQELIQSAGECVVYICEGERDVDRLNKEGLIATCNPGGAGKWGKIDDSPLHDLHVVILPDNDKPGRKHAEDVAKSLHGKAASVRIVELPGLAEHGDVSEWLGAGNDIEALDQLAAQSPEYEAIETGETKDPERLCLTSLEDVKAEPIEWLWPNRIPLGKLTLIAGVQGLGKSFLVLDIASRISNGQKWPDLPDIENQPGSVILLSAEDALNDTVVPRLNWAGADLTKIKALEGVAEVDRSGQRSFDLQRDIRLLSEAVENLGDVRLIVFDPLDSYMGADVNSNQGTDVRRVLGPLAEFAESSGAAVVGVCHLNKTPSMNALFRVCGSVAYTALARAAWLVAEDPDEPGHRLLLKLKFNLAKAAEGLGWSIDRGRVLWRDDVVDVSADEVLGDSSRSFDSENDCVSKIDEAISFLKESLSHGDQRTTTVDKWAKEAGISLSTLKRARSKLKIKPKAIWSGNKNVWYLPSDQVDQAVTCTETLSPLGPLDPLGPLPLLDQGDHLDQEDHIYCIRDNVDNLPLSPNNAGSDDEGSLST